VCLPDDREDVVLAAMPDRMSFGEAAAVPLGGLEALHFLSEGDVGPGDRLLINGAGGSIGTAGVQLAKDRGAEVTVVDRADKLEMLEALGADHVIDYAQQDFAKGDVSYDVIFDVIGNAGYTRAMASLASGGRYLLANPTPGRTMRAALSRSKDGKRVITTMAGRNTDDLIELGSLYEAGRLEFPIDRRYPLEKIVEAHRYVETGAKKGNVVIDV
jgi:NADPH:quinone reductase-like Zn-dependent oxidoreductase